MYICIYKAKETYYKEKETYYKAKETYQYLCKAMELASHHLIELVPVELAYTYKHTHTHTHKHPCIVCARRYMYCQ